MEPQVKHQFLPIKQPVTFIKADQAQEFIKEDLDLAQVLAVEFIKPAAHQEFIKVEPLEIPAFTKVEQLEVTKAEPLAFLNPVQQEELHTSKALLINQAPINPTNPATHIKVEAATNRAQVVQVMQVIRQAKLPLELEAANTAQAQLIAIKRNE